MCVWQSAYHWVSEMEGDLDTREVQARASHRSSPCRWQWCVTAVGTGLMMSFN